MSDRNLLLPGEFAVDANGAATYSVPLRLPPGTNGLQPTLSLVYNSAAGVGFAGFGWGLHGLGFITRAPRTLATDGVCGTIAFDAGDAFALNGQRLVAVSVHSPVLRTEIESGQIAEHLTTPSAGGSRDWWQVRTAEGLRLEYGGTADAPVLAGRTPDDTAILSWALNKVTDRFGNFYTITYEVDAQDAADLAAHGKKSANHRPAVILYTGNTTTGALPTRRIDFAYADSGFDVPRFLGGSATHSGKILTRITTSVAPDAAPAGPPASAWLPALAWDLTQRASAATGRPLLEEIRFPAAAIPGAHGPEPAAIKLSYPEVPKPFEPMWEGLAWKINGATDYLKLSPGWILLPADLDGDGITDLVFIGADPEMGKLIQIIALKNVGDGTFTQFFNKTLNRWWSDFRGATTLDVDGDGISEIILNLGGFGIGSLGWLKLTPDGAGWTVKDMGFPINTTALPAGYVSATDVPTFNLTDPVPDGDGLVPLELDEDGRVDLAIVHDRGRGLRVFRAAAATEGAAPLVPAELDNISPWATEATTVSARVFTLDVDGDGRTDLVRIKKDANGHLAAQAACPTGSPADHTLKFTLRADADLDAKLAQAQLNYDRGHMVTGDINGDGLVDLVWIEPDGAWLNITVLFNTGVGFQLAPSARVAVGAEADLRHLFLGSQAYGLVFSTTTGRHGDESGWMTITDKWNSPGNAPVDSVVPLLLGTGDNVRYAPGKDKLLTLTYEIADTDGDGRGELVILAQPTEGATWLFGPTPRPNVGDPSNDFTVTLTTPAAIGTVVRLGGAEAQVLNRRVLDGVFQGGSFMPFDAHGTGRAGFVYVQPNGDITNFPAPPLAPDLPACITNERGGQLHLEFRAITDAAVYSRTPCARGRAFLAAHEAIPDASPADALAASAAGLPHVGGSLASVRTIGFPKVVVAAFSRDNPIAFGVGSRCFYSGARLDLKGRGWLGFDAMRVTDCELNTVRETCYAQEFPLVGRVLCSSLQLGDDLPGIARPLAVLHGQITGYGAEPHVPGAAGRIVQILRTVEVWTDATHAYVCEEKRADYEFDAWALGLKQGTETNTQFDTAGAAGRVVSTLRQIHQRAYAEIDVATGLENRSFPSSDAPDWSGRTSWFVPVALRIEQRDADDSLLTARDYTYHPTGAVATVRDGDSDHHLLTYRCDAYGNRDQITDARGAITTTEFDATHHTFPAKVTQSVTPPADPNEPALPDLVEHSIWDARFGLVTDHTDANGSRSRFA
ncbi:MAG: hypothetical protein RLZZ15_3713, partial [Verrucomicrobiota bacterium]